ncbi:MAG: hypothetical protein ACI9QD_000108 [Thermoproteota archaeon]|jgi:hypothetical protein
MDKLKKTELTDNLFSIHHITQKEYQKLKVMEAVCYKLTGNGHGPYLEFTDGSIKFDLSENMLHFPFGHNFPILNHKTLENFDKCTQFISITDDKNKLINQFFHNKNLHVYIFKNESSFLKQFKDQYKAIEDLSFYKNMDISQVTTINYSLPVFVCISPTDLQLTDDKISTSDWCYFKALTRFFFETDLLLKGSKLDQLSSLFSKKLNSKFHYNFFNININEQNPRLIACLNKNGIYTSGNSFYLPMSLTIEEASQVVDILNESLEE